MAEDLFFADSGIRQGVGVGKKLSEIRVSVCHPGGSLL
jgi:hypothetical protein